MRTVLLTLVALLLAVPGLAAQTGGNAPAPANAGYELDWYSIDGGGVTNGTGGGYSLDGTVGQPDAGLLKGEGYTLGGGFWGGGALSGERWDIYLPLLTR